MVPDLAHLPAARPLALPPSFKGRPNEVRELPDPSLLVAACGDGGGPAWRVWPTAARPPLQLPPATAGASCVLTVGPGDDGDGYLVVSFRGDRVARTGAIEWERGDVVQPWAAVVA